MAVQIVVVEDASDWKPEFPKAEVVLLDDYITEPTYFRLRAAQVINLCRSHKYLGVGYYCSLLAEARGHRVIPSVRTFLDLSSRSIYGIAVGDLDQVVEKAFQGSGAGGGEQTRFDLDIYFGQCETTYPASVAALAREIFEAFPCPLLRVRFEREERWRIITIRPLALYRLRKDCWPAFQEALASYLKNRWRPPRLPQIPRYDLAILHDPKETLSASNDRAIERFVRAGKALGMDVEVIQRKDFGRLAEFDALFIRDTTDIRHYTYRFAKKAEKEGMVVIDDPTSILRCTNKVYLTELLRANGVPIPKTFVVGRQDLQAVEEGLRFPMVLKFPEGSFSRGVFKVEDGTGLREVAGRLFKQSELILAQAYTYTEFDWRIGVIDRRAIFACQYFMSKRHWQIYKHEASGSVTEGPSKTWPVEVVPPEVVDIALKAANLIGDGLYGVDLKQAADGIYVIEVNDNPSIDAGVEDSVLKEDLYRIVMGEFARRIERRRALVP
ncbi:MAG: RimK family protein [Pseudomonadota bacterium]